MSKGGHIPRRKVGIQTQSFAKDESTAVIPPHRGRGDEGIHAAPSFVRLRVARRRDDLLAQVHRVDAEVGVGGVRLLVFGDDGEIVAALADLNRFGGFLFTLGLARTLRVAAVEKPAARAPSGHRCRHHTSRW